MNTEYKSYIENEILGNVLFDEDYNIDTQQHFALAPKDIIKIDLRTYLKNVVSDIKAVRSASYGQVEVDDVTGDVKVNGQPLQSQNGEQGVGAVAAPSTEVSKDSRKDIVEFLKLLKSNGSLEKLKGLDPATKKSIADKILKTLTAKPKVNTPKTTPAPAASDPEDQLKNMPTDIHEEELLMKEAYIVLTELETNKNVDDPAAKAAMAKSVASLGNTPPSSTPATTPATTAAPKQAAASPTPAPVAAPKQDPQSAKMMDIKADPKKFGIDPNDATFKKKVAYIDKLEADYKNLSGIPGAKNGELIAIVQNVDTGSGDVKIKILQKKQTGADGKSQYSETGQDYTIPQNSVKSRLPAEQAKKTGLLSRIFGG